jgi:hypothetical protein
VLTSTHADQTGALLRCFETYVGSIAAFAVLYHRLYLRVPTRFLFVQDIANSQRGYLREARTKALSRATFARSTLSELLVLVGSSAATISSGFYRVASLTSVDGGSLRLVALTGPPAGGIRGVVFTYRDSNGREHDFGNIDGRVPPRNMEEFELLLRDRISQLEGEETDIIKVLGTLDAPYTRLWTFVDFLYFSTITQTTVGYGDVLPNSSLIRLIVTAQVIFGYAVLVVVLNLVILQ